MSTTSTTEVPSLWLVAVARLLNEMAAESILMEDCVDPADLMIELAEHLGIANAGDCWKATVLNIAGVTKAR